MNSPNIDEIQLEGDDSEEAPDLSSPVEQREVLTKASQSRHQLHRKRESERSQFSIRLVERNNALDSAAGIQNANLT